MTDIKHHSIQTFTLKGKADPFIDPDWQLGFNEGYANAVIGRKLHEGPRGIHWGDGLYGNGYAEGNLSGYHDHQTSPMKIV